MPRRQCHLSGKTSEQEAPFSEALKKICNCNFNIVTVINFFIMTIYYLLFVTSASSIQKTYDVTLSTAGLTAGIMVFGCLAGRFISGNILSIIGCKAILLVGLCIYASSLLCFFVIGSLFYIFIDRFFIGIGVGLIGTATATIVAYVTPKQYQGFGISLFSMSTALSLAMGPFLGILLLNHVSYETIMKINCFAAICCLIISVGLKRVPETAHRHRPLFQLRSYIDPRVVRFAAIILIIFLSYGCLQAFMTSFAAERGLSRPASFFFPIYAVAVLASRPLTGRRFDKSGENTLFYPLFVVTAFALALLAYAATGRMLLAAAFLLGLGFGNFQSIGQAVSLTFVTPSRFPQATTTFFIFMDFGIGLGPYLFGFLIPAFGYEGMFLSLSATLVGALLLYHFLHGRKINGKKVS